MNTKTKIKLPFIALLSVFILFPYYTIAQGLKDVSNHPDYKITQKVINVELYKKNNGYEVKGFEIVFGEFHYLSDYKKWKGVSHNGKVVSFKKENLGFFYIPNALSVVLCDDGVDKDGNMVGGCRSLPEGELVVQIPYFPNGKYADIFDPSGKKVLTIDLTSKATCNENDKCDQPIEDGENCPQDCKNQEPKLDPVVVEKAKVAQNDSQKISSKSVNWIMILAFGAILFIAVLGIWLWRRYRKYKEQSY